MIEHVENNGGNPDDNECDRNERSNDACGYPHTGSSVCI